MNNEFLMSKDIIRPVGATHIAFDESNSSELENIESFTKLERTAMNALLKGFQFQKKLPFVDPNELDSDEICIPVEFIGDAVGWGDDIRKVISVLHKLNTKPIRWNILERDTSGVWDVLNAKRHMPNSVGQCTFIQGFKVDNYNVRFRLNDVLLGEIKRTPHPRLYAKIDLLSQVAMKSSHSVILYELFECEEGINNYKPITTMSYSIEQLKTVLGISPEKYPEFKIFKRAVITPAIKEISRTSSIEILKVNTLRHKRKAVGISFLIHKKPSIHVEDGQLGLSLDKNQDWVNVLIKIGLSKGQIESLVTDFKYNDDLNYYNVKAIEEYLEACVKKKKEIRSKIAVVRKGFSENWGEKSYKIFKKDEETREVMEKRSQLLSVEEELNEKLKTFEKEFNNHLSTLAHKAYKMLSSDKKASYKQDFYDSTIRSNSLYKERYPSVDSFNLEEDVIISVLWNNYLMKNMDFSIPVYETWCEENNFNLKETRQQIIEVRTLMYGN